jgi:branched-chain amino acid transport system substrate-binding protein
MMSFQTKIKGLMPVSSVILALVVTMTPGNALGEKPIKLGLIDAYTGAATAFTKPALNGWQMAVDEFNSKGGLNGRKIEILTSDSKFKADESTGHARELILKEGVDFLGGTTSSSVALAVSEFAKKKKKIFMVTISRSHRITGEKGHKYIFRGCPSADIEGLAGGYYASTMPYKKWYIIGEDYEYGHSIADNFWKGLTKHKPEVEKIGEAWPKLRETDYTSYLTAMMAKNPEAVYVAFGASGLIPFFKQAGLFGLVDKVPVFAFGLGDSVLSKVLKEAMPIGAYAATNYLYFYPDTPANKAFVQKCKEKYNDPYPSGIGLFGGYSCGKFLTEAILKAKSTKTEKVIKALEGLTIDTPIGPITMRACDHQAQTPAFWGKTTKDPDYPLVIMKDVFMTPPEKVAPSCAEVSAARKAAKAR